MLQILLYAAPVLMHEGDTILRKLVAIFGQCAVHVVGALIALRLVVLIGTLLGFLQRMHGILPAGVSSCCTTERTTECLLPSLTSWAWAMSGDIIKAHTAIMFLNFEMAIMVTYLS